MVPDGFFPTFISSSKSGNGLKMTNKNCFKTIQFGFIQIIKALKIWFENYQKEPFFGILWTNRS